MLRHFLVASLCLFTMSAHGTDECFSWFKKSGAKQGSRSCVLDCSSARKDMATFECSNSCETFCKPSSCKMDPYWINSLNTSSLFEKLENDQKEVVLKALAKLPKNWRPKKLKAIVKANRPIDITSILTPASSTDEYIILYKRAFTLSSDELVRVLAHEVTHLMMENEWTNLLKKYKKDFKWTDQKPREGDFVEPDGKMSAEEDFANNIEYYLFERSTLKVKSPAIESWIKKNLQGQVALQQGCLNE